MLTEVADVGSVAAQHPDTWRMNSRLPPKTRIASGIDDFWDKNCPTFRADIAAAMPAMQNADVVIGYTPLAGVAHPVMFAIGCRLGFYADKAMTLCAIDEE
jgi:hypothetical protein